MKRIALLIATAVLSAAQIVPNRYIVELSGDPAAAVAAQKRQRFAAADHDIQAHRTQLESAHAVVERNVRGLGGTVTHHLYNVANAMAVTMTPGAAAQLARMPGIRSVTPVHRTHMLMDQALNVHRVTQAWQAISGGSANAGAGIKIGILDTGIDVSHPAFQNFSTAMPNGFPLISGTATADNTNSKVIVARVYSDLASGIDNTGTDGNDYVQHGTTVAGIAAGLPQDLGFAGIGTVSGVAPGAWLGNYKTQDDTGSGTDVTFLAGLEDALSDGMNVVNHSAGAAVYDSGQENGIMARAIANAVNAGMLVVCAAGNEGPQIGSVSSPGVSPAAIAVGAIQNQRWFWFGVTPSGGKPVYAIPPDEELTFVTGDVSGPLVDVASVASGETHACSALPANSLTGAIALIQRGSPDTTTCLFATKLNNAQAAGAIGAIVYDQTDRSFFDYALSGLDVAGFEVAASGPPQDSNGNDLVVSWSVGSATLPGLLVSKADGATLLQLAQSKPTVDLDFDGKTALPYPANEITDFSSVGPTPTANIKPDIVAVGDWLVAPTSTVYEDASCTAPFTLDLFSGCYPAYTFLDSPYLLDFSFQFGYGAYWDDGSGTSFSTPIVTGAIALLMAARPGLTGPQYRSLAVNSSPEFDQASTGTIAGPQTAGGGILDVLGAMQQNLTAIPGSLNFVSTASGGSSSSSIASAVAAKPRAASAAPSQAITLTNIGSGPDTFTVTFNSIDGQATPSPDSTSFSLDARASRTVTLTMPSSLGAGQYHGFMIVTGTQGQTPLRVPYWYGVAGSDPANLYILFNPGFDPSSCADVLDFRLLDSVGLPVNLGSAPTVTTSATNAQVTGVTPIPDIPGTYEAAIVTGRPDDNGNNVFTISAGSGTFSIAIGIDNSGFTECSGTTVGSGASRARNARGKNLKTKMFQRRTR